METVKEKDEFLIEYLIDEILPKRKLNILAGPSGSGKTTLLFNIIRDWSKGDPVFGCASNPEPYIYIALDRRKDEIANRISAAGLDPKVIPFMSLTKPNINASYCFSQIPQEAKVVFLDGFARICPGGKHMDYDIVANFCLELGDWCEDNDKTIIAVCHTTKVKQGENFLHPRHRILGSVAWGAFSSTLIFIDEANPEKTTDTVRRVEILPRTSGGREIFLRMDENGSLVPTDIEVVANSIDANSNHLKLFDAIPFDTELRVGEIFTLAGELGISRASMYRILDEWVDGNVIKKPRIGVYYKDSSRHLNGGVPSC